MLVLMLNFYHIWLILVQGHNLLIIIFIFLSEAACLLQRERYFVILIINSFQLLNLELIEQFHYLVFIF